MDDIPADVVAAIEPDADDMRAFLGLHDDPLMNPIVRIDSSDVIFATEERTVKLIGGKYMKGDLLGEGSYSKVKEVLDMQALYRRAVKIIKIKRVRRIPSGYDNVKREIKILRRLKHTNIVNLIETFRDDSKQKLYIVLEYCCSSLQSMLESKSAEAPPVRLPEWQARFYFMQLTEGLHYLHSRGVVHKDIKPGNLLLTTDETLKISDFGVSEELDRFAVDDKITVCQGSPAFQAPEIANGESNFLYGFKVDTWACGITLYNMVTGLLPFEGGTVYLLFDNIGKGEYTIPEFIGQRLRNLIEGLLTLDPEKRLSTNEILHDEWFGRNIPRIEAPILLPVVNDNTHFQMTTLENLAFYVNGQGERDSDMEEEVIYASELEESQFNSNNTHSHHRPGTEDTAAEGPKPYSGNSANHNTPRASHDHHCSKKVKKKACALQ